MKDPSKSQRETDKFTTAADLIEGMSEFRDDKLKVEHIEDSLEQYKLSIKEDEVVRILSIIREDELKINALKRLRSSIKDISSKGTIKILKCFRSEQYKSQAEKILKL